MAKKPMMDEEPEEMMEESPEEDSYPSGTKQSGFVIGDEGPFRCDNCTKYVNGFCTEPMTANDPEAQAQRKLTPNGLQTLPSDCCDYVETPDMEKDEDAEEEPPSRTDRVDRATKMLEK